jgi:small subunit ribosomal protein S17
MPKRLEIGVVTGDRIAKTRRVEIKWLVQHKKYKKYIKNRTVCYVHDENNESAAGDLVEIEECRPMSKMKRWTLKRVVEKSKLVDVAAMQAARRAGNTPDEVEAINASHVGVDKT